jgi:NNP family nitrate/nitrite transporter-like MFS transporter
MDIVSPGEGVPSLNKGIVTRIEPDLIEVSGTKYKLRPKFVDNVITKADENEKLLIWPTFTFWQEPVVKVGDQVIKKQILARGITHIFFQANVWIFTVLVFVVGFMTGIGKAAVYKHIPDYFPNDVGVVGGIVGVVGGLGGFFGPVIFGTLLSLTGIWTTCWMFFALLCLVCLTWMHITVTKLMNESVPSLAGKIEA